MEIFLGWDVGAWHCDHGGSRDALCALTTDSSGTPRLIGESWRNNLRETLNEHHGWGLLEKMLRLVGIEPHLADRVTVAIDTPLGWPIAFLALLTEGRIPSKIPPKQSQNELLFRETDRLLLNNGHRPLSVVQDMISSQSTKGLFFLERADLDLCETGIWLSEGERVTAIETYPTPCRSSGLLGHFYKEIDLGKGVSVDTLDSLWCALVAFTFVTRRNELRPPDNVPPEEGWIWLPRDCYPNPFKVKEPPEFSVDECASDGPGGAEACSPGRQPGEPIIPLQRAPEGRRQLTVPENLRASRRPYGACEVLGTPIPRAGAGGYMPWPLWGQQTKADQPSRTRKGGHGKTLLGMDH